jgi:GAF domain-containing protein/HAMP domain-containing protein
MPTLAEKSSQIENPFPKNNGTRMSAPQKSFWTVNRKLLLPSVAVMTVLALGLVGYLAYFIVQRNQAEAERDLNRVESSVQGNLTNMQTLSLALASEMAVDPQVQEAFASQDRQALQELTLPIFETVQKDFAVKQFQFIRPPATSFLRLHQLDKYGDDLSTIRLTVVVANSKQKPVSGVEIGRGGLGVRGEVPVFYEGNYIGMVDIGIDIGPVFLENLKKQFGIEAQIMLEKTAAQTATFTDATSDTSGPIPNLLLQSSTFSEPVYANPTSYKNALNGEKSISRVTVNGITYSVVNSPLRDYSGKVIGVLDIFINRTDTIAAQSRSLITVIGLSLLATLIGAFILVRTINTTIRPIGILTETASALAGGNLDRQALVQTKDEFNILANAFNAMTSRLRDLIATLEQRVADRTKALATSTEVSRRLSTILNRNELVTEVVNQIKNAFGYYHTQIYFFDEARENLVMAGGTGEAGEMMLAQFHKVAKGRGLVGKAADSNHAVLVADTLQNPEWLPNKLLPDTKSEVAIPISVGDLVLGVLDIQHNITNDLQQEDVDALQSIANQVATALQNIQSTEIVAKRATELQTVATISNAAATIGDIQKMLETVVHLTQRRFGLYHAHVFLYDETERTLKITACGWEAGDIHEGTHGTSVIPLELEQSLVARAGRTRQAVIVNNVNNEPGWLPNPLLPNTASEMAVPLIVGDQLLGILDVQSDRTNTFTDEDVNIQSTLAAQVATALQNARSYVQAQRQAERESAVNLITQKIQKATTVEGALQVAVRELGKTLGTQASVKLKNVGLDDSPNSIAKKEMS